MVVQVQWHIDCPSLGWLVLESGSIDNIITDYDMMLKSHLQRGTCEDLEYVICMVALF